MRQEQAQQAARDEKLVPTKDKVKTGKSNLRMDPTLTQKEETYQVMLDIIKNTSCCNTFLTSVDVPRCMLITCINHGEPLELSSTNAYRGKRQAMTDSDHQGLKFYGGIYHKANVDYVALIWEDLHYQIDYRQSKIRIREIMPYPRFTKVIIHHFMSQHKSISKRQGLLYHIVDDDGVLDRLKFINKGEECQVYGKPIPNSDKGAGTSPEVSDKIKDKSKAQYDLKDWGSVDDETFLFDDKEEKPEDIPWVSTNDDEFENDGVTPCEFSFNNLAVSV
uniref:Uncharacterized protein n=1 Tax=Tanacetum cinerariifolium TaxID=118510 RepID=A0A6L2JBD0_TANCI|nr:hypothetical protein [Tanacetum cinerariifolium]